MKTQAGRGDETGAVEAILGVLILVIAMASIQVGAGFAKSLFPMVGTTGATTLRLVFATLILWLVFRPWQYRITRRQLKPVIVYGLSMGAMNLLVYMAIARIPLGIAVALEFTGPLAVAVFTSRSIKGWLWAALAALGVLLLLPMSDISAPLDPLGVVFALMAGACWSIYIIFGQMLADRCPRERPSPLA